MKSPHGSLLSTGVKGEAPIPMLLTGALSRPPSRSILESGAAAETGLITEAGAGRSAGADDAPGGGGRRSGLAPKPVPPGREGLSFFRSIFRLTLMV